MFMRVIERQWIVGDKKKCCEKGVHMKQITPSNKVSFNISTEMPLYCYCPLFTKIKGVPLCPPSCLQRQNETNYREHFIRQVKFIILVLYINKTKKYQYLNCMYIRLFYVIWANNYFVQL